MKSQIIAKLNKSFEESAFEENGIEYWFGRDLQHLLEYTEWRNFLRVIDKAKTSCDKANQHVSDHFVDVNKTIPMPKGATKEIDDIMLTRYACYLIAQNGDPRKETIAFAQSYFAVQTRKQEILEERIRIAERITARKKLTESEKKLSQNIFERGVDGQGFGRIRSKGDTALFGGHSTIEMKRKLSVPGKRPLADFLPTITIKAKDFATEITNFNVENEDLTGEPKITKEHVKNNEEVRQLLEKRGIKPEDLPLDQDIKKLERKLKSDEKKLTKGKKGLK